MFNTRSLVIPLFFLTGFAGMIEALAWSRQLTALFGEPPLASGAVIVALALGLTLGGLLLGRQGEKPRELQRVLAVLQLAVGLFVLVSPLMLPFVESFYFAGGFPGVTLRYVVTCAFLLLPAAALGGIFPLSGRLLVKEDAGRDAAQGNPRVPIPGGLPAAAAAGAALGALATGLFLLPRLGAASTLASAGVIHLLAGAAFLVQGFGILPIADDRHGREGVAIPPAGRSSPPSQSSGSGSPASLSVAGRIGLLAALLLTALSLATHTVLWERLLALFCPASLALATGGLCGVALGVAAGSQCTTWLLGRLPHPLSGFLVSQAAAAILSLATLLALPLAAGGHDFAYLLQSSQNIQTASGLVWFELLLAAALSLPTSFFLGMALPCILAAGGDKGRQSDGAKGLAGSVQSFFFVGLGVGAVATGTWLIPSGLGLLRTFWVAAGLALLAGLVAAAATFSRTGLRTKLGFGLLAAVAVVLFLVQPERLEVWRSPGLEEELVLYSEDYLAQTAVVRRPDGLAMKLDNQIVALGGESGVAVGIRMGLMPALLRGETKTALCLGLGAGHTLHGLFQAGVERVACVESLPGVFQASHLFHAHQNQISAEQSLEFYLMPTAVFVRGDDRSYDLIVGTPQPPRRSGAGFYYSKEFFLDVRERLAPTGLYCLWIPLHQIYWEDFGVIGYTFSEVFDHVAIFLASAESPLPFVGLIGSSETLRLDPQRMQEELDRHSSLPLLKKFGMNNAMENLALYIGDEWLFRARFPNLTINARDRTVVEFAADRVFEPQESLAFNHFVQLAEPGLKENVISLLELDAGEGQGKRELEIEISAYSEGLREYLASHAFAMREALLWRVAPGPLRDGELRRVARVRFDTGLKAFELAPKHRVLRHNLLDLWRSLIQQDELLRAANLMREAFAKLPEDAVLAYNWGLSYLLQGLYEEAATVFERTLELDPDYHLATVHLAITLFCLGDRVEAREKMTEALEKGGGMERLSALTRGFALLILEGVDEARPLLMTFAEHERWGALIAQALKQASQREEPGGAGNDSGNRNDNPKTGEPSSPEREGDQAPR